MRLLVALLWCLVLGTVGAKPEMPSLVDLVENVGDIPLASVGDLDRYSRALHDLADVHMAKSFAAEARRFKRDLDLTSINVTGSYPFTFVTSGLEPQDLEGIADMSVLEEPGLGQYWLIGYNSMKAPVMAASYDGILQKIMDLPVPEDFSRVDLIVKYIDIENEVAHFAVADSSNNFVVIYTFSGESFEPRTQNIIADGPISALHFFEVATEKSTSVFLVVSTSGGSGDQSEFGTRLYKYSDNYFENQRHQEFRVENVQYISGFADEGNYYLVFGLAHSEGAQVYEYDVYTDRLKLIQQLPDPNVYSVYAFSEGKEHYVLMNNGPVPKMYWWSGKQLLLWQELDVGSQTKNVGSVETYTFGDMETIILVSHGGRVTIYADDVSAHFQTDMYVETNCNAIVHMNFLKIGEKYVLAYLCKSGGASTLAGKELVVEVVDLEEPVDTTDLLMTCLEEVNDMLDERKPTMNSFEDHLEKELIMTSDQSQYWVGPITFESGLSVSSKTSFLQTVEMTGEDVNPHNMTFNELETSMALLEEGITIIEAQLDGVLYHSGGQTIPGPVDATTFVADNFTSLDATSLAELNGVPILDLDETYFIDEIVQKVTADVSFNQLTVDTFSTTSGEESSSLNGVYVSDLMRLSVSGQTVTGNHKYADIEVSKISGTAGMDSPLMVNGISTTDIVTRGSNVAFTGSKTFESFVVVESIDVDYVNGVDLSSTAETLIYQNIYTPQHLAGSFDFTSLKVDGNVDVDSINSIDMKALSQSVVKTTGDFVLEGAVEYTEDVTTNTLNVGGQVNGVNWVDLVHGGSQTINGSYTFNTATVSGELVTDSVNGIDLSEDVLLTSGSQNLKDTITFSDTVTVTGLEGVLMVDGATINGIDPDDLQRFNTLDEIVIEDPVTLPSELKVNGNVETDNVGGLDLEGIEDRYWRKSKAQAVEGPINLDDATFKDSVLASTLNDVDIANYMSLTDEQVLSGNYTFQGAVDITGDLLMGPGKEVSTVDVSALDQEVVKINGVQNLDKDLVVEGKVEITGDLSLTGHLNSIDVEEDFVRLDKTTSQSGSLNFKGATRMQSMTLAANLTVATLNGMDLAWAVGDLVLVDEDATIAGPLSFTSAVNVNDLEVSNTVDGIVIEDLQERSLKKSSDTVQNVTHKLTVDDGIHFDNPPTVKTVNDEDWVTYLGLVVPLTYSGEISSTKTFQETLSINGNFDPAKINNVHMPTLASKILSKSKAQNVSSRYTFDQDISAEDLNAPVIDGIDMTQLLFVDVPANVSGLKKFVEPLTVSSIKTLSSDELDGCDVRWLYDHVVSKESGDVTIPFGMEIDTLIVNGSATSDFVMAADGRDLKEFLDLVVLKSTPQEITGEVTFVRDVAMHEMQADYVDDVNVDKLYNITVMADEENVINCHVKFDKDLKAKQLTVTSSLSGMDSSGVLINDLDASKIAETAVLKGVTDTFTISGNKVFKTNVKVNSLEAESVGDVVASEYVVLSNEARKAKDLAFTSDLQIDGTLEVSGLIDGVDLADLLANRIDLSSTETLISSTTFEGLKVDGDLIVKEINGIQASEIVVKSRASTQDILGEKLFSGGLHVEGKIETKLINGVDVDELISSIVRVDEPASLLREVTFEKPVTSNKDVEVLGTVNGFDLDGVSYEVSDLKEDVLTQSQRLKDLHAELSNTHLDNELLMCGLFKTLSFGELLSHLGTPTSGHLVSAAGTADGDHYVATRDCYDDCACDVETNLYKVDNTGAVSEASSQEGSWFEAENHFKILVEMGPYGPAMLVDSCDGAYKFVYLNGGSRASVDFAGGYGRIYEVKTFSTRVSGATNYYIVTVGALDDTSLASSINVFKFTTSGINKVWSYESEHRASSIDLKSPTSGSVLMLVANRMTVNDLVDPYTAPSQLYTWNSGLEEFEFKEQYMAQHVSSGQLISSKLGEEFLILAQLKAAVSPVLEENLEYTTGTLVLKLMEDGQYLGYQSLASLGVVAQSYVTVGSDTFLLLLSEVTGTLDVYELVPYEGFELYQQIDVCYEPVDLEKSGEFFTVSCKSDELWTVKFNTKGYSYRE